jgi:hypothetical protein
MKSNTNISLNHIIMKTHMNLTKYSLIAMLLTLLSCTGFTQDGKTPTLKETFELNQPGTLTARSSSGGIKVLANDQGKVIVEIFVRKNGQILEPSDPMVNEVLDDFDINIEKNGSDISVVVKRISKYNFWNNTGLSLTISVPHEMSCDLSSSGGGVNVSGVSGNHKISSSGGGVHLDKMEGVTEASSSGGGVKVSGYYGELHVTSSGGGVTVNDAHGKIVANSSGGGVSLEGINGDVDARSSGGGVNVSGEFGYLKAKSSGGSVRVDVTSLTKELYLQSSGGGVNAIIHNGNELGLDLDLSSGTVNIDLHNFSGKSEKGHVKGTMNNGGIPVYMRASGGNINVTFEN